MKDQAPTKHIDCKYYLGTDVFKGICKRTKDKILGDDPGCESFELAPKCKHCSNYQATETDLGMCMGKTKAYPDMLAVTCDDFSWNQQ